MATRRRPRPGSHATESRAKTSVCPSPTAGAQQTLTGDARLAPLLEQLDLDGSIAPVGVGHRHGVEEFEQRTGMGDHQAPVTTDSRPSGRITSRRERYPRIATVCNMKPTVRSTT